MHDCAGTCDGTLVVDSCGDCGGNDAADLGCGCDLPAPSGCDNECGSTATEDMCGTCDDDSSNDCVQDCAGTWGGTAV